MCDSKKSQCIKEQETSGLLSSLAIKIHLSKISFVGLLLFQRYQQVNRRCKRNEIVKKLLLAADNCMPEMHLRHFEFTYSACRTFKKEQRKNPKM